MVGIILSYLFGIFGVLAVLVLLFYKFVFLRDPNRRIPAGENIVAPADGKVLSIIKTDKGNCHIKKGLLGRINVLCSDVLGKGRAGYLVSIFMSPLDVHVNRAPISGEVVSVRHKKGVFFKAFDFERSLRNESNEIVMETKIGRIKVIQIAGFLARRIQCFVRKKQKVNKGQKIGRIVIGSQVSLILPKVRLMVKKGQRVMAGESIIAKLRK